MSLPVRHRDSEAAACPSDGPAKPRGFRLCKWYMDVVSADGHAAIGYWADVCWGRLRFVYSGILEAPPGAPVGSHSTVRRCEPPVLTEGQLNWAAPRLHIKGRWDLASPSFQRTLLSSPAGDIGWSCSFPRARAALSTRSATITGWGYAECLTLTIRPWRLPIDELRWGRFLCDDASVVWIRWRGAEPRLLILHDGREVTDAQIDDTGVRWTGGRLSLSPGSTLRQGSLGSTLLSRHKMLRAIAPRPIRAMREQKSLSRGELTLPGRPPSTGWAIHEAVRFRSPP